MIFAAMISTQYLADLPKLPVPSEMRMFPRNIHGTVVYQTAEEDRRLNEIEYSSVGVFLAGLGLGLVYMRKWGIAQALSAEDEGLSSEERA